MFQGRSYLRIGFSNVVLLLLTDMVGCVSAALAAASQSVSQGVVSERESLLAPLMERVVTVVQ